jgi:sugar transferase EpsL
VIDFLRAHNITFLRWSPSKNELLHDPVTHRLYRKAGKRVFDLALGIPLLLMLSPIVAVVAIAIHFKLGKGVFYRQTRAGRHGRAIELYKFRTMTNDCDEAGNLLPDELRLTTFGAWLRKLSLDELPQLWNVLRGDISLVGPRPLLMRYVPRYTPRQFRRHDVLPGITGWAQVNGRNAISWDEKFELDNWYVDHVGFWLDIRIVARTVWRVLKPNNINADGHATMPEFGVSDAEELQQHVKG